MGRPLECADLLKDGLNPREIADELGISIFSVMNYIYIKVGDGYIRKSDILFSIDSVIREDFENVINQLKIKDIKNYLDLLEDVDWRNISYKLKKLSITDLDVDLFKIYLELRNPKAWIGDLYYYLFWIEVSLHGFIKALLKLEYVENESDWWRKIPLYIRQECQNKREKDSNLLEPYHYLNFSDFIKIFNKEWKLLKKMLPEIYKNQELFNKDMSKIYNIRNMVMHPIKKPPSIEDFIFIREFISELSIGFKEIVSNLKEN